MPRKNIAGRDREMRKLQRALNSGKPEFIAVYGRRRVGKTFLIREFFNDKICFEIVGIHNATTQEQLINFSNSLTEALDANFPVQPPKSWQDAFTLLKTFLKNKRTKGKKVVFFDELPWLNTPWSGFLKHLENFWNSFGSKQKDLVLIVCGSAASWMIQHIMDSKGGLYNRLTGQIRLFPFTLSETKNYLRMQMIRNLDHYQILLLYMALGGVPYYWSFVQGGMSAAQVIDDLIFSKGGELHNEYDHLFGSLFNHSEHHERVMKSMAGKRKGLNRSELLAAMKLRSGGTASNIIRELETSGFIESYIPFGKKSSDALYRLSDEFTLFHLFWIAPLGKREAGNSSWLNMQSGPKFNAWSGYCFENVCLKHIEQIKYHLRIDKIESANSPWDYRPTVESGEEGAQIDMLIDRRDMVINLCEMKFCRTEYVINSEYAKELRRKIEVFRTQTQTKKSVFLTLVTTFGLKENSHSISLNAIGVNMDSLFEEISPAD
jgi:type II secretory pathway predicted ATPase ExeA